MVETYGIAIAGIDPVGTGYQGAEKMFRLNIYSPRNLHLSFSLDPSYRRGRDTAFDWFTLNGVSVAWIETLKSLKVCIMFQDLSQLGG